VVGLKGTSLTGKQKREMEKKKKTNQKTPPPKTGEEGKGVTRIEHGGVQVKRYLKKKRARTSKEGGPKPAGRHAHPRNRWFKRGKEWLHWKPTGEAKKEKTRNGIFQINERRTRKGTLLFSTGRKSYAWGKTTAERRSNGREGLTRGILEGENEQTGRLR